jgi:very-short-patch-repair endonuclease
VSVVQPAGPAKILVPPAKTAEHRKILELALVCANTTASYPCPLGGATFVVTGKRRYEALRRGYCYCSRACSDAGRSAHLSAAATSRYADPAERALRSAAMIKKMADPAARAKIAKTHRRLGHRVPPDSVYKGGPTKMEARLMASLPSGWLLHHHIDRGIGSGFTHRVEVDLALADLRLAVEVDGPNHSRSRQRARDAKKEAFLLKHGWVLLRFSNIAVRDDPAGCVAAIRTAIKRLSRTTKTKEAS